MDEKVKSLKAAFDNNIVCCFACSLEKLDLGGLQLLRFMLLQSKSVEQILSDPWLIYHLQTLSTSCQENVKTCIQAVTESHAPKPAPLTHHQFYQNTNAMLLRFKYGSYETPIGNFRQGQILKIFRLDYKCEIATNILDNMKNDFMKTLDRPGLNKELPNVPFGKLVTIRIKNGMITAFSPSFKGKIINDQYKCFNWNSLSLKEQCKWVKKTLEKDFKGIPATMQIWLRTVEKACGPLENLMLVFVVSYHNFDVNKVTPKLNARQVINYSNSPHLNNNIYWLDSATTYWSSISGIANSSDDHEKINLLKLRQFSDGCISK